MIITEKCGQETCIIIVYEKYVTQLVQTLEMAELQMNRTLIEVIKFSQQWS